MGDPAERVHSPKQLHKGGHREIHSLDVDCNDAIRCSNPGSAERAG
jgi:hypothetical protein